MTTESDPRVRVLLCILGALDTAKAGYALIHSNGSALPAVESDVDIAFDAPPPSIIEPILWALQAKGELTLLNRLHYEVPHGYYYILEIPGVERQYLHLDCLHDSFGINRYHLPTTFLLDGAIRGKACRHTHPDREAIYLLMKRAIKGKVTDAGLNTLRARFSSRSTTLRDDVETWFGHKALALLDKLLACADGAAAQTVLLELRKQADARALSRAPHLAIRRWFSDARRRLSRFLAPTGLFVVILGPDGSGKSTITSAMLESLHRGFRRTWRFHWRPDLLPKLGRKAVSNSADTTSAAPPKVSKHRGLVSLFRFIYYWLDFVLGYWLIIYPRKAQTTFIVGERYFPDVLVHPARYGFSVPTWLMRIAAKFVPSPDMLILLQDDPDVIFARKQELSPEEIAHQMRAYEAEGRYWRDPVAIVTQGGVDHVTRRVTDAILARCAQRTQRRIGSWMEEESWRAFPSADKVRVWVSNRDSLRNALNLYHPYSGGGLIAKSLLSLCPRWLQRIAMRDAPPPEVATLFGLISQEIRQLIGLDDVIISFYPGTPGPHQKITAQITHSGQILGYAKSTVNPVVRQLLHREGDILRWLQEKQFKASAIPKVLAHQIRGDREYLILSPPLKSPGLQREDALDVDDFRFIQELSSFGLSTAPVAEVMKQFKLEQYCLNVPDIQDARIIQSAATHIRSHLAEKGVQLTPSHGDYAPWNTLETSNGSMFVFDWEYGSTSAPALTDLIHRVLAPMRLVEHLPPQVVIHRVLDLPQVPKVARLMSEVGVSREDFGAYVLLYLLEQITLRPNYLSGPAPFLVQSLSHALERMGDIPQRKRILVAAYACEPDSGSEPGVGWRMCQAISREHEVWVITRSNNQAKIEAAMKRDANPYLHFAYADLPDWAKRWKKKERGVRLYYYLWQFAALMTARRLVKLHDFSLAHHVTFVNDYTFTFLGLLDIPFVWGPIGSNVAGPASLMRNKAEARRDLLQYYFKALLRVMDPLIWVCAARARLVIGNHPAVARRLPFALLARRKYQTHTAIGVEHEILAPLVTTSKNYFDVISMGNLLPIKQFPLTVLAFSLFAKGQPNARLTIVGHGPDEAHLKQMTRNLGIEDQVSFQAWLPRKQALALLAQADAFLFPSREAAGMVVLEALALGVPVVAIRNTGPGEMITAESGFAVEVTSLEETANRLADALCTLAKDTQLHSEMRQAAQHLARTRYLWEERPAAIRAWYAAATTPVLGT